MFVECPVDLLYPEPTIREWYGAKTGGRPRGLGERVRQWYVGRHLDRLFRRAGEIRASDPQPTPVHEPSERPVERASALLHRAGRPVLLVGSQALLGATGASDLAETVGALGVPVYLSGMARGLLGPDHPLQLRHRRKEALREADLVILAGSVSTTLPGPSRSSKRRDGSRGRDARSTSTPS